MIIMHGGIDRREPAISAPVAARTTINRTPDRIVGRFHAYMGVCAIAAMSDA